MAGLNFLGIGNYNKPGKGVRKDEPQKPAFIRFFQLIGRKWAQFIQLNLIFDVGVLVTFGLSFVVNMFTTNIFLCALPYLLLSPLVAGMAYITRNFANEQHVFLWSDFKQQVKENWKAFAINGIVTYIVVGVLYIAIPTYFQSMSNSWIWGIPLGICLIVAMVFLFSQFYIPIMIVTFDMKLRHIYKNGLMFSVIGLWRNLFILIVLLALLFGFYIGFLWDFTTAMISLLILSVLAFAFVFYLISFMVYPLIDKYMIQPYQKKPEEVQAALPQQEKTEISENEESAEETKAEETTQKKESDYVFVNGKLVKRSEYKTDDESIFVDRI